jgi:hypothetical protein
MNTGAVVSHDLYAAVVALEHLEVFRQEFFKCPRYDHMEWNSAYFVEIAAVIPPS